MASKYRLRLGDADREIEVAPSGDGSGFDITIDGATQTVSLERINESARYSLIVDGRPYDIFAEETPLGFHIVVGGETILIGTQTGRRGAAAGGAGGADGGGEWVLKSPMAGVVREILVAADDEVAEGQTLAVVEAMKMQNELQARRAGTVKAVYVSVGQRVDQGTPLLVLL